MILRAEEQTAASTVPTDRFHPSDASNTLEPSSQPVAFNSADVVIDVRDVGKMYRIYERPQDRLKQMLFWRFGRSYGREFWALRGVSFQVRRGETVGIIGRNGSGKSTLLQMIAGTLAPTEGVVEVRGRVAALLELGSGFNPEFTGRENVYLNGTIQGLSREEMDRRFDAIVAFADIGQFIDQPVKTYSSGMYARLAFAISIHIEPDIFIIDEALSVGDIFFQSRCLRKLDEYRAAGGTVLFVTHDMHTAERICNRSILLHEGTQRFEGPTPDAINTYYQLQRGGEPVALKHDSPLDIDKHQIELRRDYVTGNRSAYISQISIFDDQGQPTTTFTVGEWMTVCVRVEFFEDMPNFDFGVGLRDKTGVLIGGAHTFYQRVDYGSVSAGEQRLLTARIQMMIGPGTYLLLVGAARNYSFETWEDLYVLWDCCAVHVIGRPSFWGQAAMNNQLM